jgi:hypothetical protein
MPLLRVEEIENNNPNHLTKLPSLYQKFDFMAISGLMDGGFENGNN